MTPIKPAPVCFREAERSAKTKLMEYLSTSLHNSSAVAEVAILPPPPFHHHHHHHQMHLNGAAPPSTSYLNQLMHHHRQNSRQDASVVGNLTDLSLLDLDSTANMSHATMLNGHHTFEDTTVHSFVVDDRDLGQLSLEIEKERNEYMEKSKLLVEQLKALKNEIDELKVEDKMTPLDLVHLERQEQGNTKYSTIQKVKRGSTQSRVAFFEEL